MGWEGGGRRGVGWLLAEYRVRGRRGDGQGRAQWLKG